MEDFAAKLRRLRLAHGLTQAEIAEKLYVSKQAVSKWETAKAMPDVELLPKIAAILKIDLDTLMSDENAEDTADSGDSTENIDNESRARSGENGRESADNASGINGAADNSTNGSVNTIGKRETQVGSRETTARESKKKRFDTKFLKNLILVCVPVLIVVIVATVLLSVYLPKSSEGNEVPPVVDTPNDEKDPEPVFTEIRAAGEDYHERWNGSKYDFTADYKGGRANFHFKPRFSSEFTFKITTTPEKAEGYFKDAKSTLYIDYKIVAEIPCGESLDYKTYLTGNQTHDVIIIMSSPNNPDKHSYMGGTIQVEYKHDFENVTVPAKGNYTVALRGNNYADEDRVCFRSYKISNKDLKFTSIFRMKLLDPSMIQSYCGDSLNYELRDVTTDYFEMLFKYTYKGREYNNDFYYITIENGTHNDITSEIEEKSDITHLNCAEILTIPAKEENSDIDYLYYYLDATDIWYFDPPLVYSYYLVSQENAYPRVTLYSENGVQMERDERYVDLDDDPWYSLMFNSFEKCFLKVPVSDSSYQIKIEPYSSEKK